jgi:hypothetical protein
MTTRKKPKAQPSRRLREYNSRLPEVRRTYGQNSCSTQVRIPGFLHERWKACKAAGMKGTLGQFLARAMLFGMMGDHPFNDPFDALDDAFRVYMDSSVDRRTIVKELIRALAVDNGIDLKDL